MKIYIATRGYDYEGEAVIGVFLDQDSAVKAVEGDYYEHNGRRITRGDSNEIVLWNTDTQEPVVVRQWRHK